MPHNEFLFTPGTWLGEGQITLPTSNDILPFNARWDIIHSPQGEVHIEHSVLIEGVQEKTLNIFLINEIGEDTFVVTLINEHLGSIKGLGKREGHRIAWQFSEGEFEGFEVFEKQEGGGYLLHAEYGSIYPYKTIINAKLFLVTDPF